MSHYRPYPKYRDSGVEWLGEVPEGWTVSSIKRVASHNDDTLKENVSPEAVIRYVDISSVSLDKGIDRVEELVFRDAPSRARRRVKAGDVVISTVRTYLKAVTAVEKEHEDCVFSTGFSVLRVLPKRLAPGFLKWLVLNELLIQAVESHSEGLSYPAINASELVGLQVVVPGLSEQQVIASFLDRETARIDTLITKKTRFIELLKEKRQAIITQAVTKGLDDTVPMKDSGVKWLGMVPAHWNVGRLSDYCQSISTGPFGTALKSADYIDGGVPVINPSHLENGFCVPDPGVSVSDETSRRLVFWQLNCGDVITARRGELGRAALITIKEQGWLCGTGSLRLRPTGRIKAEFIVQILQSKYARSWLEIESVGSTMPNLSEGLIGRLPMVIPPSIDEQTKLLERLEQIIHRLDLLHKKTERSIELLKEHRTALITAAVTGKIDVREAA